MVVAFDGMLLSSKLAVDTIILSLLQFLPLDEAEVSRVVSGIAYG